MTTNYDTLNNLSEISFIGGTDKELTFTTYKEDGSTLLDITSGLPEWNLCLSDQTEDIILTKVGTIIDANHFTITLDAIDTFSLSGKYVQQLILTDFSGNIFRAGQGVVIILPAIPSP